jgi:hypothetical protein
MKLINNEQLSTGMHVEDIQYIAGWYDEIKQ